MEMKRLTSADFPELYEVVLRNEPFASELTPTMSHFQTIMQDVEGFCLRDRGKLAGAITFNYLVPLVDVFIHAVIDLPCRKYWANRTIGRKIGEYAFGELSLPRISSYGISDVTPEAMKFLLRLGFKQEGLRRRAARFPDGYHDVILFGVLKEEWRWN